MQIRKATADEMLRLWGYQSIADAANTARFFYRNISSGNAVFWTVDNDGELIGELYAFLNLDNMEFANGITTAYLCAFRIKKEFRGQGLGTSLMKAALSDLKIRGFRYVTIGVSDEKNKKLYHKYGFVTEIGTYYYDPCAMDEHSNPEYDETGFLLLSKEL